MKVRRPAGFTLVEIAVVLTILAVLGIGALMSFSTSNEYRGRVASRDNVKTAREAVLAFASISGRLPCPAPAGTGTESQTNGACTFLKGSLPWSTLGLPSSDHWGRELRYAVSRPFGRSGFWLQAAGSGFTVMNPDGSTPSGSEFINVGNGQQTLNEAKTIAFAVWSIGSDGQDSSTAGPANLVLVDHLCTAGSTTCGSFDDIAIWVSQYSLMGRMRENGYAPQVVQAQTVAPSSASGSGGSSSASSGGAPNSSGVQGSP